LFIVSQYFSLFLKILENKLFNMKILRNKTYSDSDNETPKKVGEAIGTALVGTAGTVGATDLIKRGAKKYITSQESKKAKKAFKEGIKKLDSTRKANNFKAEVARGETNSGSALDLIFHKRKVKKADQVYKAATSKNNEAYKSGVKALKKTLISNKDANIAKRTGRVGKIATTAGLIGTGIAAGMKLRKKDK
jgi:hypothetical protein